MLREKGHHRPHILPVDAGDQGLSCHADHQDRARWRGLPAQRVEKNGSNSSSPRNPKLSSPSLESCRGLCGAQSVEVLFPPCCFYCSAPSLHQHRLLPNSPAAVLCSSISQVAKWSSQASSLDCLSVTNSSSSSRGRLCFWAPATRPEAPSYPGLS